MADLIDRQAAIDAINSFFGFNIEEEYGSAVQEVINSLPSAHSAQDCISREMAIDAMSEALKRVFPEHRQIAEKCLNKLPAAQPQSTMGQVNDTAQLTNDCISRQEALDALKRDEAYDKDIPNRADGVRDAIITIMELPTAQPEPSQIARDIATIIENEQDMRVILAQPERMRGRWIEITASDCSGYDPVLAGYDDPVVGYVCSTCHEGYEKEVMGKATWKYCPNCGSFNGGEQE